MSETNAAPKTPPLFTQFFDAAKSLLRRREEQRMRDALKRTMASEERMLELSEQVTRARVTKQFLDSEFWADYLEPWLRSESVLKPATFKDGDPAPSDRAFHEYLVGSGKVIILTRLIAKLDEWIDTGDKAQKVLELEAEKRQRLREEATA